MNIKCTFSFTIVILQPFPTQLTALHLAARFNPAAVPVLLEANPDVNVLNGTKWSPLFWAARSKQEASVVALMAASANPHLGDSPLTQLDVSKEIKDYIRTFSK